MTTWGFLLKKSYGLRGQCGTSSKIRSDTGQKHSTKAESRLEMRKAKAEPAKHKSGYAVLKERAEEPEEKDELRSSGPARPISWCCSGEVFERTWSSLVYCSDTE
ncbi:hypothetical protein D4764_21G0007650 [Takifugu flavidus]|uniref:Uncharacterized protein n=1 Tax=Takifugu flavidus TaxID=433684 RepID=A0A5C6NFN2_9TELE|nr:hypothetical protein D4764_21G0007650 [Takifugu flavidus]